ncbi:hypothetical protein Pst134EA_003368 [Puccinia striiformis f. sp. tritici]|uniref:hypothetical protein n=1 Tax=Puccinia striiformis f. sp. tritici TaxID=168172 RepID=UPI000A1234CA|nr:hypothetical protein Pst134EA_003368 [Puccinia striiformis f. sp. tritici]KAH9472764.1 hypothetical protein Pst134EA_003368 [Puccinia striiformis f. sp. tritici]KAI9619897.1 hypothetical protein KEM48_008391 [Puccinia striiformis f. sp. tritici PST-130]
MNPSSETDAIHNQVLTASELVDHLDPHPVPHPPKHSSPLTRSTQRTLGGAEETCEFDVLTPYDQNQIDCGEISMPSNIGGLTVPFSQTRGSVYNREAYPIDDNVFGDYDLFHRPGRHDVASPFPFRRQPTLIPSLEPLIADVGLAKSRLLITKTHCLYPMESALIPFPSCLIGFRLVIHPCHPKARLKHVCITLNLYPEEQGPMSCSPMIKAIYPLDGKIHETGERTSVQIMRENSAGVQLGIDPYGAATLTHAHSVTQASYTVPYVLTSGVYSNTLSITMNEDNSLRVGVAPSLYFAALLELPSSASKAFRAHLQVASQSRKEHPFQVWCSPKTWRLDYDGQTELGQVDLAV